MRELFLAGILLFLGVCICAADEGRGYTLDDCVRLSLKESAITQSAAIDEAVADSRVKQARSIALPHVSVQSAYRRLDELQKVDVGNSVQEMGTIDNYSVDATVNQLLFAGGKVSAALNAAAIARKHAASVRTEIESSVAKDATSLFNNILLAEKTVAVVEESVSLLQKMVKQTEDMMAAKKAAEFDVLTAQVRYQNELPQLLRAKNTLAILKENMKRLMGIDGPDLKITGDLEYKPVHPDEASLIKQAKESRALLRASEQMSMLLKEDIASARSDMVPSVSAFFGYNGANSYGFVSFGEEEWEWHWSAGLALKWNVWDGDLSRAVLREKKLEYSKSVIGLDDTERAVALEVKSAVLNLESAAQSVESAAKNVVLAEKAMEIAATRHEAGLATYLDYTDANVALKQARLAYFSSVCSHMNAIADLNYAVGAQLEFKPEQSNDGDQSDE